MASQASPTVAGPISQNREAHERAAFVAYRFATGRSATTHRVLLPYHRMFVLSSCQQQQQSAIR